MVRTQGASAVSRWNDVARDIREELTDLVAGELSPGETVRVVLPPVAVTGMHIGVGSTVAVVATDRRVILCERTIAGGLRIISDVPLNDVKLARRPLPLAITASLRLRFPDGVVSFGHGRDRAAVKRLVGMLA